MTSLFRMALLSLITSLSVPALAEEEMEMKTGAATMYEMSAANCSDMEYLDIAMGMCMPLAMPGMPMRMLMVHGNAFLVGTTESGPRGKREITAPDMFMADLGTSIGDRHYLNLDFMGTLEKWVYPDFGYPELLQIGEDRQNGTPFIDAQHPHSTPIMGLTLSDTISFGHEKDNLKVSFAPRGESTDGPIAFMHRPTGMVNPDAPLGHHIGQDVGHVSSTVFAASLKSGGFHFEASTFHGAEPSPTAVDLPIQNPDSFAFRVIEEFSDNWLAMASFAQITNPEPEDPGVTSEQRYSASVYYNREIAPGWKFYDMLVWGLVTHYDNTSTLTSFGEEFLFRGDRPRIWGRIEVLQRTAGELEIAGLSANDPHWVTALTLGYTHRLASFFDMELGLGGSGTVDLLPGDFKSAYGGTPWTGRVFLQLGGMGMWNL